MIAGWLTTTGSDPAAPWVNYSASSQGVEDVHYNLILDAMFLDHMYGPGGLSAALSSAVWPGNPPAPRAIPFATERPLTPGGPAGASYNSWILPMNGEDVHGELNAWHVNDTKPNSFFTVHLRGRGQQPAFWVNPLPIDRDA